MALKGRFRKAASSTSRNNSLSLSSLTISSPASSTTTSPNTSPNTSPFPSRTPSTVQLPLPSPSSEKGLKLTKTTSSSTSTSRLSLRRFRSNSSKREASAQDWARCAPRNYKFGKVDPESVAVLGAWEWQFGSVSRARSAEMEDEEGPMGARMERELERPVWEHVEDVRS